VSVEASATGQRNQGRGLAQGNAPDSAGAADPATGGGGSGALAAAAPKPASLTLLATGAFGLLCYGWRKRNGGETM
jgi:hypothetical protein